MHVCVNTIYFFEVDTSNFKPVDDILRPHAKSCHDTSSKTIPAWLDYILVEYETSV